MEAGIVQQLRPGVRRLVAPNPGLMTGPGTNTYLLGERNITVLDPGPALDAHIDAIDAAIVQSGGRLQRVVVTHTHPDHSPGAALLAERYGVPLVGQSIANDGHQDDSFKPDEQLQHDVVIDVEGVALRAIHTPGHVDNHFCYFHEASGLLFTGDHIMQGSTVVIIPPAGDMADYMASLRALLDYPMAAMAPGHGTLIESPHQEVQHLLAHRQGREDKVHAALTRLERGDLDDLVTVAYDDVDASIHPIAKLSLWAHLLKLQKEQRAEENDGIWAVIA